MKTYMLILIIICVSIVLIGTIHYLGGRNSQSPEEVNVESEEFRSIKIDAENAYVAQNYTQAIALYEQALELRPENAEIYNDLGSSHYDLGLKYAGPDWPSWKKDLTGASVKEAYAELDYAIEKTESGYIVLLTDSTEIVKAIQQYVEEKGGTVFPHYGNTDTTLNILIGSTKDHLMHARWLYLKSIEYKSTYDAPYRNLGSFYMKIGLRDKAINFLLEAKKRAPGDEELAEYLHQFGGDF